ncbi:hypothetical protein CC80DRAFT_598677 [Byssothecium circinans]|uniref:Uncharacterized protein n=1 Tax=Byssothecium circinans TaxID=147558 RepID=A0A6A5TDR8_9PLEO|nr:hypothetical protein CC80DRAFT_598677 [Byssothecium circinans]
MHPLLLVSKQVRAETLDALVHHKLAPALDIAIIDWHWLWPTWRLNIPRTEAVLDRVDINILLATEEGNFNAGSLLGVHMWRTSVTFWSFISRLLNAGPANAIDSRKPNLNIRIRELRINLKLTSNRQVSPEHLVSAEDIPRRKMDGFAHLNHDQVHRTEALYGDELFTGLRKYLEGAIQQPDGCTLAYEQLAERVGKIVFKAADSNTQSELATIKST